MFVLAVVLRRNQRNRATYLLPQRLTTTAWRNRKEITCNQLHLTHSRNFTNLKRRRRSNHASNLNSTSPVASRFSGLHPERVGHGSTLHRTTPGIACSMPIHSCGFALPSIVQSSQARSRRASRTLQQSWSTSPPSASSIDRSLPTKSRHTALRRSGTHSAMGCRVGPTTLGLIFKCGYRSPHHCY